MSIASAPSSTDSVRLLGLLSRVRAFIIRAIDVGVVAVSFTAMVAVAVRTMIVGVIVMTVGRMVSVSAMAVARERSRMAVASGRSRMAVAMSRRRRSRVAVAMAM